MELYTPISAIDGIGPSFQWKLKQLEINTVADLIDHFPFRYDDFSNVAPVVEAKEGERVTLKGEVWSIQNVFTRSRKIITKAVFNDGTAPIELIWFNQHWLTKQIKSGDRLQISGKISRYKNKVSVVAPVWEKVNESVVSSLESVAKPIHTGRLVPVYPETYGLTSKWLRTKISDVLPRVLSLIKDPLPEAIRGEMPPLIEAYQEIHFPTDYKKLDAARNRLAFDELFYIQLATQKIRLEWQDKQSLVPIKFDESKIQSFIDNLPFKLTSAQTRVINEVISDLSRSYPMNRLVQGEVGSGKTVVAAALAYLMASVGMRTLVMAPTEILAFQHHKTMSALLEPFKFSVGIYTGSRKKLGDRIKNQGNKNHDSSSIILDSIPDVIVGTHALVSKNIKIDDVGLVIIDEQQRFGVEQRSILRARAKVPHFLTMTATPIPRTVALTLYGDLDLSVIDEMPANRQRVKTHFVPSKKRKDAYKFIAGKVIKGDQVYVVTPLIEESETLESAKAAKVEFIRLSQEVFPNFKLGLLHGRLTSKEKDSVLNKFKDGELDILVSTTVVEVGVDVPNATIMIIEGAERFGLAQLHQLRGRVGRGDKESFCFLFASSEERGIVSRLKNLETIYDGMKLSELDLKIRGGGEVFGTRQSGRFNLKIASLADITLLERTRREAREVLLKDPRLEKHPQLRVKLSDLIANASPD